MHKPIILAILLGACLSACSPQKRLNRLLEKHPELRDTVTVVVRDTVIVPGDTARMVQHLHTTDTVIVETERQAVRVVRIPTGSPCDTAAISVDILAAVKPDTVYLERKVEVTKFTTCKNVVADWWRTVAYVLGALLLVILFTLTRPTR
jgi:uncharacterized ion transporter superfamily protein YfcC